MNESQFLNMFRDAESYGFLSVPILVPPMIEEAFVEANTSSWVSASTVALCPRRPWLHPGVQT
jgi:hypothetical protein